MSEILDIAAALSRLLKAENVLLICHKNPDGDTSTARRHHRQRRRAVLGAEGPGQNSGRAVRGPHPVPV